MPSRQEDRRRVGRVVLLRAIGVMADADGWVLTGRLLTYPLLMAAGWKRLTLVKALSSLVSIGRIHVEGIGRARRARVVPIEGEKASAVSTEPALVSLARAMAKCWHHTGLVSMSTFVVVATNYLPADLRVHECTRITKHWSECRLVETLTAGTDRRFRLVVPDTWTFGQVEAALVDAVAQMVREDAA